MSLTKERINEIAKEFLALKKKSESGEKKDVLDYRNYQNYCTEQLAPLVKIKTNKYKKFSNYPDLLQDGFEALMLAFETYNPKKGDFAWWAMKYIGTKVSRAANTHSTIRIPLKKARDMQPYKTSVMPVQVDKGATPAEEIENNELSSYVKKALAELSEKQKRAIMMYYEFAGTRVNSISDISKELKVSRPTCVKLISEAEKILKSKLSELNQ